MDKILLIEDDPTMSTLLTTLLQYEGYIVEKCEDDDPQSLFDAIRQQKPDVTLLDVNLRHANGIDLLRQVRSTPELKELHILMSSGLKLHQECINAGADNFLMKPYMPEELMRMIKNILGKQQSG